MTHSFVWYDSIACVIWLTHMRDMTHSYVWHDSHIRVTWLNHMCDMTHPYDWNDSRIRVTWLAHMFDMTHSSTISRGSEASEPIGILQGSFTEVPVLFFAEITGRLGRNFWALLPTLQGSLWHDSFICIKLQERSVRIVGFVSCDMTHSFMMAHSYVWYTWHIHTCDVTRSYESFMNLRERSVRIVRGVSGDETHPYVWRDSLICVTWLTHMCDRTHPNAWQDSFIYTNLRERRVRIVSRVSSTSCRENGSRTLDRAKRCTTRLFSATIELRKVALRCTHDTASASSPCATIIPLEEKKGKRAPHKNYIASDSSPCTTRIPLERRKIRGGNWWQRSERREIQGA